MRRGSGTKLKHILAAVIDVFAECAPVGLCTLT